MDPKEHWEAVFTSKSSSELTWYQRHLQASLDLIRRAGLNPRARLIDIGAGDCTLVDDLLELGFTGLTVLDISSSALQRTKDRLGSRANQVTWLEADILKVKLPALHFDLWHDRAVFHFLTNPADRRAYVATALHAMKPGGRLIISAFAHDGPERCSGLPTERYSPARLHAELGQGFELLESRSEAHATPWGGEQRFIYCEFKKL